MTTRNSNRLKEIRKSLNLSQEGVAQRANNLSSRTVKNAEDNKRVTFDTAIRILGAVNSALKAAGENEISLSDLGLNTSGDQKS